MFSWSRCVSLWKTFGTLINHIFSGLQKDIGGKSVVKNWFKDIFKANWDRGLKVSWSCGLRIMLWIKLLCLIKCDARSLLLQVKGILFLDFRPAMQLSKKSYIPITPKIWIHFVKRPSQVLLPQNRFYQSATQQAAAHQQPSLTRFPCREKQN